MPRGGKRTGSGRKAVKPQGKVNKAIAEKVLDSIPESEYWQDLVEAEVQAVVGKGENREVVTYTDKRLRLEVLKYLTDKRDGKAPMAPEDRQAQVVVNIIRDPQTPVIQVAVKPEI